MPTQEKIELVERYADKFKGAKSIFLADFKGINVEQDTQLRRVFREKNVQYFVLKNTLAKRSLHNAGIEELDDLLKGVTSFAMSDDDPVAPIKVIKDFVKEHKLNTLSVKGCVFEGNYFGPDQAEALANLPTREALIGQFVGMLQSPMTNFLGVLQATGRKLAGVLEAVKNQKTE